MTSISPICILAQRFIPAMLSTLAAKSNAALFPASICSVLAPLAIGANAATAQDMLDYFKVGDIRDIIDHQQLFAGILNTPDQNPAAMTLVSRDAFFYQIAQQEALTSGIQDFLQRYPNMFLRQLTMDNVRTVFAEGNAHLLKGMESVAIDAELLKPDGVTPDTGLVLANRAMAEWRWRKPFTPVNNLCFHTPTGDIDVPGLVTQTETHYESLPTGELVAVPMLDPDAQFFIFLPGNGLNQPDLSAALARMAVINTDSKSEFGQPTYLNLYMPAKTTAVKTRWNVKNHAKDVGLGFLFEVGSYFNLIPGLRASASTFEHNSTLEWDKEGGRAVGETVSRIRTLGIPNLTDLTVRVDRPFMAALFSRGVCLSTALIGNPLAE